MANFVAARDISAVFRFLKTRGWSRAAIAAATGLSETRVRAISQGKQQITSYDVLERIAEGLNIDRGMIGLAYQRREPAPYDPLRQAPPTASPVASHRSVSPLSLPEPIMAGLASVRVALDLADLPPDGPVRSLAELTAVVSAVVRLRLRSNYLQLSAALPDLLGELHQAYGSWTGQRQTAAAALLVQAYRAADALADKFSEHDLSARIIAMMLDLARQSGDELLLATASYVRGELYFTNNRPDVGRALLERAADRLVPGDEPTTSAAYGSLHMRAAVLAGQAGQLDRARDHLAEAREHARLVPEGEYCGTAFGPSSVRVHEVTLAVDTGDPDGALRVAQGWDPPEALPGERRSHFYVDLARARVQLGAVDEAVTALFQARAVAPEHVRAHPQVRQMVTTLISSRPVTSQLDEYASWAGIRNGIS